MPNLVAVYGSLRKGLHNHRVLGDSKLITTGLVKGFGMYSLGAYPALSLQCPIKTDVVVEVYEVVGGTMNSLDMLEGYPSFYTRKLCVIETTNGDVEAWVYFIKDLLNEEIVECGDWVVFLGG